MHFNVLVLSLSEGRVCETCLLTFFHALCTNNIVVTATIYLDSLSSSVPLLYALQNHALLSFFKGYDVMSTLSSYIILLSNLLSRRSRRINKLFMRLAAPQLNTS